MEYDRLKGKRVRIKVGGHEVNGEVVRVEPRHPKDPSEIVEIALPVRDGRRVSYRRYAKDVEEIR